MELRERIARGEHGRAGELGSEQQLGDEFGVSRITIRRALTELRNEGLLLAGRGRGWRVAGTAAGDPIGWFRITTATPEAAAAPLTTEILAFETIDAPGDVELAVAGPVLRVVKLVFADGVSFDLTEVTIAAPYSERITRRDLQESPPARLLAAKGCDLGPTEQFVTATVASELDAPLRVTPGEALLVVRRTVFDAAGNPVLRTVHRHPASCTRIELTFPTTDQTHTPPVCVLLES